MLYDIDRMHEVLKEISALLESKDFDLVGVVYVATNLLLEATRQAGRTPKDFERFLVEILAPRYAEFIAASKIAKEIDPLFEAIN